MRVTTSYGAVASTARSFIVSDGVTFSPVTSNGRVVTDGFVATAGRPVPLRFTVIGKVPGTQIALADMTDAAGGSIAAQGSFFGCWTPATRCPTGVVVDGWATPTAPGRYLVRFEGRKSNDQDPATFMRTLTVQPAAVLPAAVGRTQVPVGTAARVTGRVVRVDTRRGVAGVPVQLQWRRAGTRTWATVTSTTTGRYGTVARRVVLRTSGSYRWVSPGIHGTLGSSRRSQLPVRVIR